MGMNGKLPDKEAMQRLGIDAQTLESFKKVREQAIAEVKKLDVRKKGKARILGMSGSARDEFDMAQESSNSKELLRRCLGICERAGLG